MIPPNLDELNNTLQTLLVDLSNSEEKLKAAEESKKQLTDEVAQLKKDNSFNQMYKSKFEEIVDDFSKKEEEANLLSEEVTKKAIEIKELREKNKNLSEKEEELNEKIKQNEIELKELREIKKIFEEQKYDLVMKAKLEIEKEKSELEVKYNELEKNLENERAKFLNLDKIFYQYKKDIEKSRENETNQIKELEQEIKTKNEKIDNTENELNETKQKLKECMDVVKRLQKENDRIKSDSEEIKTDSFNKIEKMKQEMEKASKSVFSTDNIFNIISDNIHNFYKGEFSLSFVKIVEDVLKNFILFSQIIFTSSETNDANFTHSEESINLKFLKDTFFYIYFYMLNEKTTKKTNSELDDLISISNNDFTDDIINKLSNEIYENNFIHQLNEGSQKVIDEYLNNLKKLGVEDEALGKIKEKHDKKKEQFKIYLLNIIKSLVKKCSDSFRNSTLQINNKVYYDFRNFTREEFKLINFKFNIYCDKITNEKVEIILNTIKYSSDKIKQVTFSGNINSDLSEYNLQKILLTLMIYVPELLSFTFNSCQNLKDSIFEYVVFVISNLTKLKVLSLDSCKIGDQQLKLVLDGIKDSKSIMALLLMKNNITSAGGFYLSEFIKNNISIRQIFLGYNKINGDGLNSLLNIMSTSNKNITNLDLSYNNFKLNEFNILVDYLKTNPILNNLNISGNELDFKSVVNLGAVLISLKNIKSLNMSNMKIKSDNVPVLFKSFNSDEIILDDNELDEVGHIMLSKALAGNKNLKLLSLKKTKLNSIGLINLLGVLLKIKEFKELHLENNEIDETCINTIKTTIKSCQYKIFVSKSSINKQDLFKDDAIGKESKLILV